LIAGVLLAAGESRRFGGQKLLESWHGEPLVGRAARCLVAAGLRPVVVVVGLQMAVREALADQDVDLVENAEPSRGIAHSISLGIGALPASSVAALLAVADQPFIDEHVIARLCAAFRTGAIVSPRFGSHAGNPRIFDRRFFAELARLSGDVGGQQVAAAHPEAVIECIFPEQFGLDLDRREDWPGLMG
jgi:molybdenum cofactor cytidylyltransferase